MCAPSMFCDRDKEKELADIIMNRTAHFGFTDEQIKFMKSGYLMGFLDRAGIHALSDSNYAELKVKFEGMACFPTLERS